MGSVSFLIFFNLSNEPAEMAFSLVYQDIVAEQHALFVASIIEAASEYPGLDLAKIIEPGILPEIR